MAQVKQHQLREIGENEEFSPKVDHLAKRTLKCVFSFRKNAQSPRYEKAVTFSFADCTEQEILELALATVRIKVQGMIRQLPPEQMLSADALSEINVKRDMLDAPSKSADPLSSAVKSMMKLGLSEEDARAAVEAARVKASSPQKQAKRAEKAA